AATAVVILLTTGLGVILLHAPPRRTKPRASSVNPRTLAVLPFLDVNHDPATRYLSDGITDELIARLGRIPTLRVVAQTSAFSLRGKPMDVREAGHLLGAGRIVEGSIQQAGPLLRIDVALVNAADGYELWTDEFTVRHSEIFHTEDAIAQAIAGKLNLPSAQLLMKHAQRQATVNPQARDFYLVGLEYLDNRDPDDINRSIAYLRKSIQADGNYAQAWAALAMAYAVMRSYQADVPPDTLYDNALAAANRAIALDASLPRAQEVLGLLDDQHWEWRAAGRKYRLALRLDPSDATAHQWYAIHLWFMGQMQKALHEMQAAHRLDPLSPVINADLGRALCYAGQWQASLAQYRTTVALAPRFALTDAFMAETDLAMGNPRQALADARTAVTIWGHPPEYSVAEIGVSEALLGRKAHARQALDELQRRAARQYVSGVLLAWLYWNLGEKARTFTQLQRAVRDHDFVMMFIFGPLGAGARADPRFAGIRKLMNLPPAPAVH
ncbi:MAG: tetratricopeptide repeat protein, partial [Gammaproteobacteria bacterium]